MAKKETLKIEYNGKYYGVVGKNNTIVVPFEYDEIIRTFSSGLINVCKNDKWGCLDLEGNVVIPLVYDWIYPFGIGPDCLTQVRLDGRWGLINKTGDIIVPINYEKEIVFKGKASKFVDVNGNTIIVNSNGTIVSNDESKAQISFNASGLAILKMGNHYGLVNEDGQAVLDFEYSSIQYSLCKECYILERNGLYGIASLYGKLITDTIYNYIGAGDRIAFIVKKNEYYGAINCNGKIVIPIEYDEIKSVGKRCFRCSKNNELIRYQVGNTGVTKTISIFQNKDFSIIKKYPNLFIVKYNDGRCGLMNKQEELITDGDFESVEIIQSKGGVNRCEIIAAKKDGLWGIFDLRGKIIAPFIYDRIGHFDGYRNLIEVFQANHCGLLRKDGTIAAPCVFDSLKNKDGGNSSYRILSLDTSFRRNCVKIDGRSFPKWFGPSESYYITMKKGGYWGAFDYRTMREVVSFEYNQIDYTDYQGYILVKKDNKWGMLNDKFKVTLKIEYDWISIQAPLIKVKRDNKWGAFDIGLKLVIPIEYESITLIGDNKIQLLKEGLSNWKFYRKDGKIIDLAQYSMIEDYYSNGVAMVKKNDKYGFINEDGVEVIPCIYDDAHPFKSGIAIVEINELWGALNDKGAVVIPFEYMLLADLSMIGPTLLMAVKDRLCGVIDKNNDIIVPFEYDGVLPMFGMITVIKNGKKGLFNHKGVSIIPLIYDDIECPSMHDTVYRVCNGGKWGVVDKKGIEIVSPKYDQIGGSRFDCGRLAVCNNGKWGFINRKGREAIDCIYDEVFQFFEENHCQVKLNGEKITIDIYGNRIG